MDEEFGAFHYRGLWVLFCKVEASLHAVKHKGGNYNNYYNNVVWIPDSEANRTKYTGNHYKKERHFPNDATTQFYALNGFKRFSNVEHEVLVGFDYNCAVSRDPITGRGPGV